MNNMTNEYMRDLPAGVLIYISKYYKGDSLTGADPFIANEKCKQRCAKIAAPQKSCCEDKPVKERVAEKGYHYAPLYRNIYGHSPRKTGLKSIYA